MSSYGQNPSQPPLIKLRHRLEVYSKALQEWQEAIDEADEQISNLAPLEAEAAADEIAQVRNSHAELKQVRQQVDDGWTLYHKLSENAEMLDCINVAISESSPPTSIH